MQKHSLQCLIFTITGSGLLIILYINFCKFFKKGKMNFIIRTTLIMMFCLCNSLYSEEITQTVRGKVADIDTKSPLSGARVVIAGTKPVLGAITDKNGNFEIKKVALGRYTFQTSYIGYQPSVMTEIQISSGKEIFLNIELKESSVKMQDVVVRAEEDKGKPLNSMAIVSSTSFAVEETRRFAGGFDDPLRLVASFAGIVANPTLGSNDIVIRGNSPKGLLWRLEGVDIPNPNHFGAVGNSGGGVTIFSSQLLANSDFFTAAFPTEYGNCLSGVFDMNFRTGNYHKAEYAAQIGLQGIEVAAEGPFVKDYPASYLFNYRYSTLGLLADFLPELENGMPQYQDLSFKMNYQTQNSGTFSLTGIMGFSKQKMVPEDDVKEWEEIFDTQRIELENSMAALILSHNINFGTNTYLKTSLVGSEISMKYNCKQYDTAMNLLPKDDSKFINYKFALTSALNHKFGASHTNRTGFIYNQLFYDIDIRTQNTETGIYQQFAKEKGNTGLLQLYSQSRFDLWGNVTINAGVHFQYFALNQHNSIEPRLSAKWAFWDNQSIGFGYGLHSQLENVGIYLAEQQNAVYGKIQPNKDLDFSKAHHFVINYENRLSDLLRLKIEPYYQHLFSIPVSRDGHFSMINYSQGYYNDSLVNEGTGENYGIDITLEKFLSDGYYFMLTGSFFDSKYKGGDEVERNTKFNCKFVANALVGMEFKIGDNNILGLNTKITYNGGGWYTPIDLTQSIEKGYEILDYSNIFNKQFPNFFFVDFTITYKMNYTNWASSIALQIKNLLNQKIASEYYYNPYHRKIDEGISLGITPNLSFKIEF